MNRFDLRNFPVLGLGILLLWSGIGSAIAQKAPAPLDGLFPGNDPVFSLMTYPAKTTFGFTLATTWSGHPYSGKETVAGIWCSSEEDAIQGYRERTEGILSIWQGDGFYQITRPNIGDEALQLTHSKTEGGYLYQSRWIVVRDGNKYLEYLTHSEPESNQYVDRFQKVWTAFQRIDWGDLPHGTKPIQYNPGATESPEENRQDDTSVPAVPTVPPIPVEQPEGSFPNQEIGSDYISGPDGETIVPGIRNLLAGGVAVVGAGLLMLGSGVRPREVVEGVKEILRGGNATPSPQPPSIDNEFEQWKQDYESRGWRYRERDGMAEFEPVEGATNEGGWVYSEENESFVPPEGQRPVPEMPVEDVIYKEEVRLLQENLERQRDLLDRERERVRSYEEAGLEELVPGARERVREYEKLAELDEKELKRLEEDLPVHTREDNRDLESEAGERVRSRETIRELNESEAKTEEIEDTILDRETREHATQQAERLVKEKYGEFEDRIQEIIDRKTGEGYYVRNPNLPKKAWNNTVGRAIEWAGGWKGGQCGEYGKWGMDWSKNAVKELFGSDAIVTDISASNNPFLGHRATKVILPDGRRVVVDFWESMPEGKPKIYDEKEWIDRWSEKLWSDYLGKAEVDRHPDELMLKKYIGDWGEESGKEKFRNYFFRRSGNEHAEILIRSWDKEPW